MLVKPLLSNFFRSPLRSLRISLFALGAGFIFSFVLSTHAQTAFVGAKSAMITPVQPWVGEPVDGLSANELHLFKEGKKAFRKDFAIEISSTGIPNGFGPIFNQGGCVICHTSGAIGGGIAGGTQDVTRFGDDSTGIFDPMDSLGGSLQQRGLASFLVGGPCQAEVVPPSATININRVGLAAFGAGFIEAISDKKIIAYANNQPPEVSGRVHFVKALEDPTGPDRVGRFGWKSQLPTALSFSSDASNMEMGITNAHMPLENYPNTSATNPDPQIEADCDDQFDIGGIDDAPDADGYTFIQRLTHFMQFLAPPPQTPKSGMRGEYIFNQIGCASCHKPKYTTANRSDTHPLFRKKEAKLYSDLLLHDMGALGDGVVQGDAQGNEFRTPFLWGLGWRFGFMHDDRIFTAGIINQGHIDQAVAEHDHPGSEAHDAAVNYNNLSQAEKDDLFRFLLSLGRREFNFTSLDTYSTDNEVDDYDWPYFANCYHNTSQNYTPEDDCALGDINQDTKVNNKDFQSLFTVYKGPIKDCQCNGQADLVEVLNNPSIDADNNGSPDQCNMGMNLGGAWNVSENGGTINVSASVSQAPPGSEVEFFLSFDGHGNGGPYGSYCLNVAQPISMGIYTVNSSGNASFADPSVPLPPGEEPEDIYLQAVVNLGDEKSNVLIREITYN